MEFSKQLVIRILFLTHKSLFGYITRLSCQNSANFTIKEIGVYYQGNIIKRLTNIGNASGCVVNCVTTYDKCMFVNYNEITKVCELQSNPSRYFNATKKLAEVGWIFLSTNYSTRLRGTTCQKLNPCNTFELCYDTCSSPYYRCENLTNITSNRSMTIFEQSSTSRKLENAFDGNLDSRSKTEDEQYSWFLVSFTEPLTIEMMYGMLGTRHTTMTVRIGDIYDMSANPICTEVPKEKGREKYIECNDGILKGKYIFIHRPLGSTQGVTIYEIKVFVSQN